MITDHLANGLCYAAVDTRLARAIEFLQRADLAALPDGRHDVDGDAIYALVQRYTSKLPGEGRWEAHQRYADLQTRRRGRGAHGLRPDGAIHARAPTIRQRTSSSSRATPTSCGSTAGEFIVLWPGEVHMPGMAVGAPGAPSGRLS